MGRDSTFDSQYWDHIIKTTSNRPDYVDPFLGKLKKKEYLDLLERFDCIPKDGLVLKTDLFEEASGFGYINHLLKDTNQTIGLDISLSTAQRVKKAYPQIEIIVGDITRLPFKANKFEMLLSPSTLDHFASEKELKSGLAEIHRILKPNATLLITLDNTQNITDPILRLLNRLGWLPFFIGFSYNISQLCAVLRSFGFRIISTDAILHNPRLLAAGLMFIARKLGWRWLIEGVKRLLILMQRLGKSDWKYYTGSFIAVQAIKKVNRS